MWFDDQLAQLQALSAAQNGGSFGGTAVPGRNQDWTAAPVHVSSIRPPRAMPSELVTAESDAAATTIVEVRSAPIVQQLSLVVGSAALGWYLGQRTGAMVGAAIGASVVGGMVAGVIPAPETWSPTDTPST